MSFRPPSPPRHSGARAGRPSRRRVCPDPRQAVRGRLGLSGHLFGQPTALPQRSIRGQFPSGARRVPPCSRFRVVFPGTSTQILDAPCALPLHFGPLRHRSWLDSHRNVPSGRRPLQRTERGPVPPEGPGRGRVLVRSSGSRVPCPAGGDRPARRHLLARATPSTLSTAEPRYQALCHGKSDVKHPLNPQIARFAGVLRLDVNETEQSGMICYT
jgi:hypothetical protein